MSYWSSGVCSSDLPNILLTMRSTCVCSQARTTAPAGVSSHCASSIDIVWFSGILTPRSVMKNDVTQPHAVAALTPVDRTRVEEGKSVSVSVELGGRRIIKKTNDKSPHTRLL